MTEKSNRYLIDETNITIEPILDKSDKIENIPIDYISDNKTIDKSIESISLSEDNIINSINTILESKLEEIVNVENTLNNSTVDSIEFILNDTKNTITSDLNNSVSSIELKKESVIDMTDNTMGDTTKLDILHNYEKYVLKTEFIEDMDKFQNKLIELFDTKFIDLKNELIINNNLLYEKQNHINTLEMDLKNKEILINDKMNIVENLDKELEELKQKIKQQNIVKLLTKLKSDEIKYPIIVMENEDLDKKTNVVKFTDESKINLIKRRKNIF